MNNLRILSAIILLLGFGAVSAEGSDKSKGASGSTEGTFLGVEKGDHTHLQIKDKKGKETSFIVLRPDKSVQSFLDNPAKLKGRKIRVFWKEELIPEAGGKEKTVTKVESRDPLDH